MNPLLPVQGMVLGLSPKQSLPVGIKKISRRMDGLDLGLLIEREERRETCMGGSEKWERDTGDM